jgi:serine phosphatase RsbU (regulator of sigma subunit)
VTVAPPPSRLHLVPALLIGAVLLLCSSLAWPAAAKQPADTGPPAHSQAGGQGAETRAAQPGFARHTTGGPAKPGRSPVSKPAPAPRAAAPGQLKKSTAVAPAAAPQPAAQAAATASAPTTRNAAKARAAAAAKRRARTARAARRAAASKAARRAAAVTAAATAARRAQAAPSGDTAGSTTSGADGERGNARKERSRTPRLQPIEPQDTLPQPLVMARDIVEVVPTPLRVLLAALVALAVLLALVSGLTLLRNRRLAAQRRELLGRVGLLQAALLPELPDTFGPCRASVAYRPADGPGAGGDFYDVLPLAGGKTAVLIGDVSGHGRAALGRTALARYTLRAYIEAGLEPREALQIAGSVMAGKLEGDFVTALVAVHDAAAGTLTYASAGHPPPIVVSDAGFEPVLAATAPPLGVGASTGQRQTTLPFPRGAIACFYTDGLSEARTGGSQLGSSGLERLVRELGPGITAEQVIDRVAASAPRITDDLAVCVITAESGTAIVRSQVERLEVSRVELRGAMLRQFLDACGVSVHRIRAAEREAGEVARQMGGALVEVRMGDDLAQVDVLSPDLPLRDEASASLHQR